MTTEGSSPPPPEPATLAIIARHLATEEYTLEQVLQHYQITKEVFDEQIAPNEYFKLVLAEYTKEWHSLTSTHKRLAFFAAAALEEKLPILAARMGDRGSALADAVATAKLFRELAGIVPPSPQQNAGGGQGFSIRIDFGNHKVALEAKADQALHPLDGGEGSEMALLPDSKVQSLASPVQPETGNKSEEERVRPLGTGTGDGSTSR